jgi:hypothetical protein
LGDAFVSAIFKGFSLPGEKLKRKGNRKQTRIPHGIFFMNENFMHCKNNVFRRIFLIGAKNNTLG